MRILVLQHERVGHPGRFRSLLGAAGHEWQTVVLDEGETLPPLDRFDALWVMGGPMDVWQEDAHPWLTAEKALIREAVSARGMPYLGICLGHQLLADALDGNVGAAAQPEIGLHSVSLSAEGRNAPVAALGLRFEAFQWHSAEVLTPPPGARVLARSPACAVQALQWGSCALSVQFHPEIDIGTLHDWNAHPRAPGGLDRTVGAARVAELRTEIDAAEARLDALALGLWQAWRNLLAGGAPARPERPDTMRTERPESVPRIQRIRPPTG